MLKRKVISYALIVFFSCTSIKSHENSMTKTQKRAPEIWSSVENSKDISQNILYFSIADNAIKNIPIQESNEKLIDLLKIKNPRIKPLSEFNPAYENTYEGFSQVRLGLYRCIEKMLLILPNNIGIAYFEGFRSLEKQKEYFDKKFKEILLVTKDKEKAYEQTSKLVSPFIDNIPTHCTGAAIDITLFRILSDEKKELLDMGKFDVIF